VVCSFASSASAQAPGLHTHTATSEIVFLRRLLRHKVTSHITMSSTSVLGRALFAYSLPAALLSNLSVRSIAAELAIGGETEDQAGPSKSKSHASAPAPALSNGTLRCTACPNAAFETVEEQRTHFKSDWHRYNAKARLEGKNAVGQEEWDNMVEGELVFRPVQV
jgi:hypothetical protein